MENNVYLIIVYTNNIGRILCHSESFSRQKEFFDSLTSIDNKNNGLYELIQCDKKYIEFLGMSMRDSDLNFTRGEFDEVVLESKKI